VISVVHAAKLTVKNANPPVLVLAVEDLDRVLSGLSPVLKPDQVTHIYDAARDARTWAACSARGTRRTERSPRKHSGPGGGMIL
jgi:hypothetical protein